MLAPRHEIVGTNRLWDPKRMSYQVAFKEVIWGGASWREEVPPDLTLLNAHRC